jgi:GMP synthase-like glutamine amidotransferase
MGGPMGVHDDAQHPWMKGEKHLIGATLEAGKRVFGVCLGAQMVAHVSGARVYRNRFQEIGWFPVEATPEGVSSFGFPHRFSVFHWHGDTFHLPAGAVNLARTDACEQQMFVLGANVIGVQFHLEVTPEDVAAMCDHDGAELPEGPYVQTVAEMRDSSRDYLSSHRLMESVLDRWMGRACAMKRVSACCYCAACSRAATIRAGPVGGHNDAYTIADAFPNLTFSRPTDIKNAATARTAFRDPANGQILVFSDQAPDSLTTFLDISSEVNYERFSELGLLGLAFHPDTRTTGISS